MAEPGNIGRVSVDVAFDKINLPDRTILQEQFDRKVKRGLSLKVAGLDLPSKKIMQRQLDLKVGKGLKVKANVEFSATQIRSALRSATTNADLSVKADVKFNASQVHRALRQEMLGKVPRITVEVDVKRGSYTAVVQEANSAQREITEYEIKEREKRRTSESRFNDRIRTERKRHEEERRTIRARSLRLISDLEKRHASNLERIEAQSAQRIEAIEKTKQARLEVQRKAFEQRRILAAEAEARRLQRLANRPVFDGFVRGLDRVNAGLAEFDRTMSRILRNSLSAFTVWSAGVSAAVAGVAAASAVAFGKLEVAATQAGTVVAAQLQTDEFLATGKAISSFTAVTEDSARRIQGASRRVALATTGFSPVEVTEGIKALLQSGQSLDEALKNIGNAARFAQVNEMELVDASQLLSAGLAASGKSAEYSAKLLDQISFTARSALGDAGDYLEAFANRGASSFRTYGKGIDETLTLLALLGQTGVTGKVAGTQASIVIRDIEKAILKSGPAFKKYGIAVKTANTPNVTFNETLVDFAAAFERAQKAGKSGQLVKDLGLVQKSLGSIQQIVPQVNAIGIEGLNNFQKGLNNSGGAVAKQVTEVNKKLAAQFDKLKDAIDIAFGQIGERFGPALAQFFDLFSGPGGLIPQAAGGLNKFGDAIARIITRMTAFVKTQAFRTGIATFVDAIRITLRGVSDTFREFGAAFRGTDEAKSTFVAFAETVRAFAQISAAVLPEVARILGNIFKFLIDNKESFEIFAKSAVAVYALRKAYVLLIKPVFSVVQLFDRAAKAIGAKALTRGTSSLRVLGSMFARLAGPLGIVIASIEVGIHAWRGFTKELTKGDESTREFHDTLRELRPIIDLWVEGFDTGLKVAGDALAFINDAFEDHGRRMAGILKFAVIQFGDYVRLVKAIFEGDLSRAFESFADILGNAILVPVRLAIKAALSGIDKLIASVRYLTYLDPVGGAFVRQKIDDAREAIRGYSEDVDDLRVNLSQPPGSGGLGDALKNLFDGASDSITQANDDLIKTQEAFDSLTASVMANNAFRAVNNDTKRLVDLYNAASGRGPYAQKVRDLLGLSQAEAQDKLVKILNERVVRLSKVNFAPFAKRLGDATRITPTLNGPAIKTIQAQLQNIRRERAVVLRMNLPKAEEKRILGRLEAQEKKLQSFLDKRPLTVRVNIGGTDLGQVRSPFDPVDAIGRSRDAIRAALRDPSLVATLSDEQRMLLARLRKQVGADNIFSAGLVPDSRLTTSQIAQAERLLDEMKSGITRTAPTRVKNTFIAYAKQAALGLVLGAKNSTDVAAGAGKVTGEAFDIGFRRTLKIASPSLVMNMHGRQLSLGLIQGIEASRPLVVQAGLDTSNQLTGAMILGIRLKIPAVRAVANAASNTAALWLGGNLDKALRSGENIMKTFLTGLKQGFGEDNLTDETRVAGFLHTYIPRRIGELKGPVSYDATILVPAGQAIMHGLDKGLRTGFSGVESFLRDVGPSMEEFVPDSLFAAKTKKFMVDVAMGEKPDPYEFYKDLIPETLGSYSGTMDPTLAFLHKTLSLADTQQMAAHLAKLYGLTVTSTDRAAGTLTSSGNVSDHTYGTAADISGSASATDAMVADIKNLYGEVFKQIIWHNRDVNRGWPIPDHEDHAHLAWLMGQGFSKYSGKIGEPRIIDIPGASDLIDAALNKAAQATGVPLPLIAAVAKAESGFNPSAGSPAGARGLMQLMPGTAASLGVQNILNPYDNALGGAKYLKQMLSMFGGNINLALAGYNAGPGAASFAITAYEETREYIKRVRQFMRDFGGFREHGGPVSPSKSYVVGERGPEVFRPSTPGTIINARDSSRMLGGGGATYQDNRTINVNTAASDPLAVAAVMDAHTRSNLAAMSFH